MKQRVNGNGNGNHEARLRRAEEQLDPKRCSNPFGGRDVVIRVQFYGTERNEDTGERRDIPIPATYDKVDFDRIVPRENGDRIAVVYSRVEDESN
jgi:hypothetical protein